MSELKTWPVTLRLKQKGIKVPKDIIAKIFKAYALEGMKDKQGIYKKEKDGIWFLGIKNPKFRNCYGFLPWTLKEADPYQAIPAGSQEWFPAFLKKEGFEEVTDNEN